MESKIGKHHINVDFVHAGPCMNVQNISNHTLYSFVSPYLREDAVDFVVLKHRWRWKQVEEEDEMRMAVKREAILLHS